MANYNKVEDDVTVYAFSLNVRDKLLICTNDLTKESGHAIHTNALIIP
jgi:hypothetical protein